MPQTILVVEDNDRNRRLMRILLKAKGYEVTEATTGKEAMDYLSTQTPDLILMDIQLPRTDGLTLTKEIKSSAQTKDIPIIADLSPSVTQILTRTAMPEATAI